MIIDTHCHFDMLPNPEAFIKQQESEGNTIIGMTNLPSHYCIGRPHVNEFKHIRMALGFHPLYAEHKEQIPLFIGQSKTTSYIGEIGLDFSHEGIGTKMLQINLLQEILSSVDTAKKILSVHSRGAEKELLDCLKEHNIKNVIFHWYSGPIGLISEICNHGYYFSVNESMTISQKGQNIIRHIPEDRILTESDAPYNKHSNISNTYSYLESVGCPSSQIEINFNRLISNIR